MGSHGVTTGRRTMPRKVAACFAILVLIAACATAPPTPPQPSGALHPVLPARRLRAHQGIARKGAGGDPGHQGTPPGGRQRGGARSEEHTSELQSHLNLVCRLLLGK